jgi:hypothetical protein
VRTQRGALLRFEAIGGGALSYYPASPRQQWKSRKRRRWIDATTMTSLRDLMDAEGACHELEAEHEEQMRLARSAAHTHQQERAAC